VSSFRSIHFLGKESLVKIGNPRLTCFLVGVGIVWIGTFQIAAGDDPGEIRKLQGHVGKVTSLALSPDGKRLVSGSDDMTARLWDVETGQRLQTFSGATNFVLSVDISADGKRILTGSGGEFRNRQFSPGSDKSLRLWDAETGKELLKQSSHEAPVWCVRFLPDRGQALSITGEREFALRIWNLEGGKELRRIGSRHSGQGVALSPDGTRVATGAAPNDSTVRIWDVASGKELRRLEGHRAMIRGAAWSANGRQILSAGGNFVSGGLDTALRLWDAETGKELRRFEGHSQLVWCAAISPDGTRALSGGVDGSIRLWDVETARELHKFTGHEVTENDPRVGDRADVRAVLFLPNGKHAVSAGHDQTIRVWRLPD
jgi:WD40 repeat protein